jgi:hypothetical protein
MSEMTTLMREPTPPPDTPCKARATISMPMLVERAQIMELAKNRATVISKIGLRPHISENFVQTGPTAVVAMTYAAPIQEYPDAELRSAQIVGIAVATIVVFRAEMKVAD